MKYLLSLFIILFNHYSNAQINDASKIIVTVTDTTDFRKLVKTAFAYSGFTISEGKNTDTITTFTRQTKTLSGYLFMQAIIKANTVTFSGWYDLKYIKNWTYGKSFDTQNYKPVIYFSGSNTWEIMMDVAIKLLGTFTYEK